MVLIAALLASLSLLTYIPVIEAIAQIGATQLMQFLAVFGSGCPLQGSLVIGFTCSLVGAMFNTYALYNYQHLRGNGRPC